MLLFTHMISLRETLAQAQSRKQALGHFNFSDSTGLRAIFEAAHNLNLPVLVGLSEGERGFVGDQRAVDMVRGLREEYDYPIFLNADHTHSLEKIKAAVQAGFDAVLFDGGKLSWEENLRQTKEVVDYVKSVNPNILVEGEIGYIGSGSQILKEVPEGAALDSKDLTTPEQAKEFVQFTGVDLLAPAVGNIHGIIVAEGFVERLDQERVKAIQEASRVPLVIHGASGLQKEDLEGAVRSGVGIVHINTELRVAWTAGIKKNITANPEETTPYKLLGGALDEMRAVAEEKLKVFARL